MLTSPEVWGVLNPLRGIHAEIQRLQILTLRGAQPKCSSLYAGTPSCRRTVADKERERERDQFIFMIDEVDQFHSLELSC